MSQSQSLICSECRFVNVAGSKHCGQCGAKLTRLCKRCWASNPNNVVYCRECGIELSKATLGLSRDVIENWRRGMFSNSRNHLGLESALSHKSNNSLQRLSPPIGSQGEIVAFCAEVNPLTGIWAIWLNDPAVQSEDIKIESFNDNDRNSVGSFVATNYRICISDYRTSVVLTYPYENFSGMSLDSAEHKPPDEEPPFLNLSFDSRTKNSSVNIALLLPILSVSEFNEKAGCLASTFAGMMGGDVAFHNQRNINYIERREIDAENEQKAKEYMHQLDVLLKFFEFLGQAKGIKK